MNKRDIVDYCKFVVYIREDFSKLGLTESDIVKDSNVAIKIANLILQNTHVADDENLFDRLKSEYLALRSNYFSET